MLDRIVRGEVPDKHHIAFRDAEGRMRHEECLTRQGFDGAYTILYHTERPHTHRPKPLPHGAPAPEAVLPRPLRKRHYRTGEILAAGGPPVDARVPLVFNDDIVASVCKPTVPDPVYFANGDGDDLYFVLEGAGTLRTVLGDLRFGPNDYVCVPRGVLHRFIPDEAVPQYWLQLECRGGMGLLSQWRNESGQLRMDAPYCHRDFVRPTFEGPRDEGLREILVKRNHGFHGFTVDHPPLDVVGWDGAVYPFVFPIMNFQPRAGLVHLPPTWHGTFSARGALVCSFVPRVLDFHPEAVPCPYPHSSVDCDEIIFYARGNFTSRRGVGPGSISHHPAGVPHGPHPGAYENSVGATRTDELAVMVDTFKPLEATRFAVDVEDAGYMESFVGAGG